MLPSICRRLCVTCVVASVCLGVDDGCRYGTLLLLLVFPLLPVLPDAPPLLLVALPAPLLALRGRDACRTPITLARVSLLRALNPVLSSSSLSWRSERLLMPLMLFLPLLVVAAVVVIEVVVLLLLLLLLGVVSEPDLPSPLRLDFSRRSRGKSEKTESGRRSR